MAGMDVTGKETKMSEQVTNLVQNYIAVWNERDAGKRRLLIDKVFSDECVYIDPNDSVAGRMQSSAWWKHCRQGFRTCASRSLGA
jgi:hypothetical protein